MGKREKPSFLEYLNAVKKADREREIATHGKLISTRPLRIVKSKKVYDRNRKKRDCSNYDDSLSFFSVHLLVKYSNIDATSREQAMLRKRHDIGTTTAFFRQEYTTRLIRQSGNSRQHQ